jgi:hypothetical protein
LNALVRCGLINSVAYPIYDGRDCNSNLDYRRRVLWVFLVSPKPSWGRGQVPNPHLTTNLLRIWISQLTRSISIDLAVCQKWSWTLLIGLQDSGDREISTDTWTKVLISRSSDWSIETIRNRLLICDYPLRRNEFSSFQVSDCDQQLSEMRLHSKWSRRISTGTNPNAMALSQIDAGSCAAERIAFSLRHAMAFALRITILSTCLHLLIRLSYLFSVQFFLL